MEGNREIKLKMAAWLAALPLFCAHAAAADWPMFRADRARTGFADEQAAPPLTKAWEFTAGGEIVSSPAVKEGRVYFGSRDGKVRAVSALTGALLWEFATGGWVDSSPAAEGTAVYAASLDGYLYAIDAASGALLWRAPLGGPSVSSPLVMNGRVYVGAGFPANSLRVLDAASGAPLFSRAATQPVDSAPSTDGETIYFGANDGALYAFSAADHSPDWVYSTLGGRYGAGAAAVYGGVVYALPGYDENKPLAIGPGGVLLNPQGGIFEASGDWVQASPPAAAEGRLYFQGGSSGVSLFAASVSTSAGALPYLGTSTPSLGGVSPRGMLAAPAVAGGTVYVSTAAGYLSAFSTAPELLPLGESGALGGAAYSSPAVANGRVYAAGGSRLSCFRAAYAAAISSPAPETVVSGTVSVTGYAADPSISSYDLEYGSGDAPASWTRISSAASAAVEGGAFAVWDTTGLPNGRYTLRLTVLPGGGSARLRLRVNAPPPAPAGLAASDVFPDAGNRIALSWPAVSPAPAAYRVYRDGGAGFSLLASTGSITYLDAAAVTGTTYTYTVRAWDGYAESADSTPASAFSVNDTGDFTAPAAITDLFAEPGPYGGSLLLTWTAPGNDGNLGTASHYLVRCSTSAAYDWSVFDGASLASSSAPVEGPAGDNQSALVPGLRGGVPYHCAVKTADFVPNLSALSNVASSTATPDTEPPGAPSGLTVTDTPGDDGGSLGLAWTLSPDDGAGARDVYGYKVYRATGPGAAPLSSPLAVLGPGSGVYQDTAAVSGQVFYYSVAAYDSANDSALTPEVAGVSASNWRYVDRSQGGFVKLSDGARVDFPGGAVSQNASVILVRVDPVSFVPLAAVRADTRANPTSVVYEVKLRSPATLDGQATLALPYTDAEAAGMKTENLRLYTAPSSAGPWTLLKSSRVDTAAKKVSAEISHLSLFRIMEYVPSGAVLDAGEVYTYPNPARGPVTFKFRPVYKADIRIEIYNVAGEKVARLEKLGCAAGVTSEIVWDAAGIASGVYVYRVEAKTEAGKKTVEKKLAIIR